MMGISGDKAAMLDEKKKLVDEIIEQFRNPVFTSPFFVLLFASIRMLPHLSPCLSQSSCHSMKPKDFSKS
jgi:hypothetical protein